MLFSKFSKLSLFKSPVLVYFEVEQNVKIDLETDCFQYFSDDTQLSYDEYHGMFESAEPLVELERYRKLLEMHSQEEHDTEADDSEEENEEKLGHGHSGGQKFCFSRAFL